ncbi:YppG family protein [Virgibacillus alimentarius]|uniref:Spore coat protein n=2 Tax=Virgibacillus alimentarius TaxID=698769 RepID=A0ABS4S9V9_9BACI|nr:MULTISPECIES: YppG family protein [Virgibacillus]MBP2258299.1 hypothetical protein [Virgibacillus alimentarius]HLR67323.1 YppG family protein [Virgibacillus sp.]
MYNRNSYQSLYYRQQPDYHENPYYYSPVPPQPPPEYYYSMNMPAHGPGSFQKTPFEHFAKPHQPINWYQNQHQFDAGPNNMGTANSLIAYFQDENGQVDFDKMFSTVGQLANTVQQVSPLIKQFGSLIKSFK